MKITFPKITKIILGFTHHQIKRGGLGVAIDILFRVLLVTVPDMKDFYQALVSDVDRENALKLVNHSEPIRITEDVLLGAMSIQR